MITTTYRGTAQEQWALAGIDLALGRITAVELHALGERLLKEDRTAVLEIELSEEQERTKDAEERADEAQGDLDDAEKRIRDLKKRVKELEAKRT